MVNELRVNWKASLFSAFGFERPADANQFEGVPCPVRWKQQFVFLCFPSRLCERQCCPVSARDSVFPPPREAVLVLASAKGSVVLSLRETVLVWLLREALLFPYILLSVCMRDSFFFNCPLVDALTPHVVISHLLRAPVHVVAARFRESKQHVSS